MGRDRKICNCQHLRNDNLWQSNLLSTIGSQQNYSATRVDKNASYTILINVVLNHSIDEKNRMKTA